MFEKLKHLLRHSIVYGISNAAVKVSGIILLPIYTSRFSVDEWGKLGLALITITLFAQTMSLGQGQSLIRFSNLKDYEKNRNSILFTISIFILIIVSGLFLILEFMLPELQLHVFEEYSSTSIHLSIGIASLMILNNLFLSRLRANQQSAKYTISNIAKLVLMTGSIVIFLLVFNLEIEGVLLGYLLGELALFVVVAPQILKEMEFKYEKEILKESLKFGLPLVFTVISMNLLNTSDRYLLKILSGNTEVGLYDLGSRISGILNMFVIMPFNLTLIPVAYKIYGTENDQEYYRNLKNYFAIALFVVGIAISIFAKEIVMIFALNNAFFPAAEVVPYLILSNIILGLSMMAAMGIYLSGKTQYIAYVTLFAAVLNIGLNYLLIPEFGIIGAAIASAISFLLLYLIEYVISNRLYKIDYDLLTLVKISIISSIFYGLSILISSESLIANILFKAGLFSVYILMLFVFNIINKRDRIYIVGAIKKWSKLSEVKNNLSTEFKEFNKK